MYAYILFKFKKKKNQEKSLYKQEVGRGLKRNCNKEIRTDSQKLTNPCNATGKMIPRLQKNKFTEFFNLSCSHIGLCLKIVRETTYTHISVFKSKKVF